ncbi:MAG: IS110 family transposase, partial [Nocardioidaceae bacterium]
MEHVVIGVDPHKLSATIEVVDDREQLLGSGRFTTDRAGYAAMRRYAKAWPDRVWAVEGSNGAGRPLAQRLLEDGEQVVDVPAKLAARVRLFDTGHSRKTDARDAHSIAIVAVRTKTLRVLQLDGELQTLRMLTDRREALTRRRVQTVDRLQALLAELPPGQAERDLTTGQAKAMLASVRPRDIADSRIAESPRRSPMALLRLRHPSPMSPSRSGNSLFFGTKGRSPKKSSRARRLTCCLVCDRKAA